MPLRGMFKDFGGICTETKPYENLKQDETIKTKSYKLTII